MNFHTFCTTVYGLNHPNEISKLTSVSILIGNPPIFFSLLKQVGGFGPHGITNQIAYFSPQKTWLPLTTIPHIECTNFGCTVLQNTLYVIGGCFNQTEAALTEHVHPFGFSYNPRQNVWSRISPMNRERCRFTLTAVNDKLVAIGN